MLKTKACGFGVLLVSVVLIVLAIIGAMNVPVGLNEQVSM